MSHHLRAWAPDPFLASGALAGGKISVHSSGPFALGSLTRLVVGCAPPNRQSQRLRSATLTIGRLQRSAYASRSAAPAMTPSGPMTSQQTPTGGSPAAVHRATVHSVCPARAASRPARAQDGRWSRGRGRDPADGCRPLDGRHPGPGAGGQIDGDMGARAVPVALTGNRGGLAPP